MKELYYAGDNTPADGIPVCDMSTEEIRACLIEGFEDCPHTSRDEVRDRLILELEIRHRGWSSRK
jgi:hypothetical protein